MHGDDFFDQVIKINPAVPANVCEIYPAYDRYTVACNGLDEPGVGTVTSQYCDPQNGFQQDQQIMSCDSGFSYVTCEGGPQVPEAPAAICLTPPCMPPTGGPNSTRLLLVDAVDCVHSTGGKDVLEITNTSVSLDQADFKQNKTLKVNVYVTLSHSLPPGEELRVAVKFYDKEMNGKLHIAHGWLTTSNETSLTVELSRNYDVPLTENEAKAFQDADGLRVKIKRKSSGKAQPKLAVCQNWKRVL